MNKKRYQKPDMMVYQLNHTPLLQKASPPGGEGGAGYIPRVNEDMNELT